MSTDTPRTDAVVAPYIGRDGVSVDECDALLDCARTLERDLTAAREQIAELDATVRTLATVQTQLIAERDAARYRWLREHTAHTGLSRFIRLSGHQLLDAAIDAAMRGEG